MIGHYTIYIENIVVFIFLLFWLIFCLFEILIHFKIRRVLLASLCEHITQSMNEIFQKKKKKGMGEIVAEEKEKKVR